MKQKIALLGSTGSIGEQTLEVLKQYSENFEVTTLVSHSNWKRLAAQAIEFGADSVVIANKERYTELKEALASHPIKVYAGEDAICQVVGGDEVDTVVNAIVGYAGLAPTIAALEAGKKLALANKESLVVAGDIVMALSKRHRAPIIPIDSEHSAIFQCLVGESSPISRLILTASGGPFLGATSEQLKSVTPEQALRHPTWKMGDKITIDSATMINKGFEVIEAHWLFGVAGSQIDVVVHPQSIIHSVVEFADGALKAQLGLPDMRLPIQYALTFPHRWEIDTQEKFDFATYGKFTFSQPDRERFPALDLAYGALERGGNSGCVLNAANEVAVAAFLSDKIGFMDIPRIIEQSLEHVHFIAIPTLSDYQQTDREAREFAKTTLSSHPERV